MTHILIDNNFAGVPKETAQQPHRKELPSEGICDPPGASPPQSHSRECTSVLPWFTMERWRWY